MSTNAERMRAMRRRRKAGAQRVTIDVLPALSEHLIELGWLKAWDAEDRAAVAAAIEAFHRDALRHVETVTT